MIEPSPEQLSDLVYRNQPKTPDQYKLGPIKKKMISLRGITPETYVPKISNYSNKKPRNPLNKKHIEQLLDSRKVPINPYDLPQDEFTKKLIKNYE
jgi:hypothetical protein